MEEIIDDIFFHSVTFVCSLFIINDFCSKHIIIKQKRQSRILDLSPLSHFFWGDLSQFSKKPNKTL